MIDALTARLLTRAPRCLTWSETRAETHDRLLLLPPPRMLWLLPVDVEGTSGYDLLRREEFRRERVEVARAMAMRRAIERLT